MSRSDDRCAATRVALVVALGLSVAVAGSPPSGAAPPPDPLPWERVYVDESAGSADLYRFELWTSCTQSLERGVIDNDVTGAPRFGVVGDSVQGLARSASVADPLHYWAYATHCGERFRTVINSGRLDDVLATSPEVLVAGLGSNNLSSFWVPVPSLMGEFKASFQEYLDRTDHVPCRVVFNMPERWGSLASPADQTLGVQMIREANAFYRTIDPVAHPNVFVVDWHSITVADPLLLHDDQHLTYRGINRRINETIAASRRCFPPDTPQGVQATPNHSSATIWWTPLPEVEDATYRVTASTGQVVTTPHATVNLAGLTDGTPVQFQVTAINDAGESTPSAWSAPVTPSGLGARFHSLVPVRALDTRDSTGGKAGAFGPGETFALDLGAVLPPEAAGASAVALNVTATGQSEQTFITVWPGGQSKPFASSLNPRPGIAAMPAMVTTRIDATNRIQLYNNSGWSHLIVDVLGWYDAPGSGGGALFVPMTPTRVLDSRDGTGAKSGPFAAAESHQLTLDSLPVDASAAVLNVTATNTTKSGFVTIYPSGASRPLASSLNPQQGITRANLTVAELHDRKLEVYNQMATTDLVMDLVGYYTAEGAGSGGSEYFPITAERRLDSREGTGGVIGPVANSSPLIVGFAGVGSVPAPGDPVVAVDVNLTVVGPSGPGHVTVWPSGPMPVASVLNHLTGETVSNRAVVGLDTGSASMRAFAGLTHYVVDVSGWFGPSL